MSKAHSLTSPTVVVVGPVPPPIHGASQVTAGMFRWLQARLISTSMIDTAVSNRHRLVPYHIARGLRHLRVVKSILRDPPRLVYIGGAGGIGLLYQSLIIGVARLKSIPVLFHHHSFRYLNRAYLPATILGRVCGDSVEHVALTDPMEIAIRRSFPKFGTIHVWSNASFVELSTTTGDVYEPTVRPEDEPLRFGHLSNLSVDKGLADVIDVLRVAAQLGVRSELVVAGPATSEVELKIIRRAELEFGALFQYKGALDPSQVGAFMAQIDIFLFPSRYVHEAEPLVVLEAAAAGVPTIAVESPGLSSLVNELGGELVNPGEGFGTAAVRESARMVNAQRRSAVLAAFLAKRRTALDRMAAYFDDYEN